MPLTTHVARPRGWFRSLEQVFRPSRPSKRLRASLVSLFLLAAVAVLPAGANAAAADQSAKEIRSFWTPERMASAIPGDALLRDVKASPAGDLLDGLGLGMAEEARGNPGATRVRNPSGRAFRMHGKVFFRDGGVSFVCSGTSVRAATQSLVVTAGHCTYSRSGGYVTNFMFVPAYDNGQAPFGEFTARSIRTTQGWQGSEDIRYDVGMATVGRAKGKTLAAAVGTRGITFGKSRNQRFRAVGYPAADPYDGERMYLCNSPAEGADNMQRSPKPTRIDCDMTGGSSGGGWVIGKARRAKVNSVVSYGYECVGALPIVIFPLPPTCDNPQAGKLFGPYFGSQVRSLYRAVR